MLRMPVAKKAENRGNSADVRRTPTDARNGFGPLGWNCNPGQPGRQRRSRSAQLSARLEDGRIETVRFGHGHGDHER